MPAIWRTAVSYVLLLCGVGPLPGQDTADGWLGKDILLTSRSVTLCDDQHHGIGTVKSAILQVERVQGDMLGVRSMGREGWIAKTEAVPLDQAVAYFTDRINH